MKKLLIIILCSFYINEIYSIPPHLPDKVVKPINSRSLQINFDNTIHLVFNENIKYFDRGSEDVLAKIAESINGTQIPNILQIKANNENYENETNISVITTNGLFYSFSINYSKEVQESTIFVGTDSILVPTDIPVCNSKNVHLLFPGTVKYMDTGNEQSIILEKTDALNVIKFKANSDSIPETNLSVITEDDKFYSFILKYTDNPITYNYTIGTLPETKALLGNHNEKLLATIAEKALQQERKIYHIGLCKNKMEFYCSNIFIKNDILFFCFGIENTSNINFNIDFVKCFIKDIKRLKNTTIQEAELDPLIRYNYNDTVVNHNHNSFVLAFNKFTIPDKKKLEIELFDQDGGRHLRFKIENNSIINAEKLEYE